MIVNSLNNQEYKTGYKKAYSDLSNAILNSIVMGEYPDRNNKYDKKAAEQEWNILKQKYYINVTNHLVIINHGYYKSDILYCICKIYIDDK